SRCPCILSLALWMDQSMARSCRCLPWRVLATALCCFAYAATLGRPTFGQPNNRAEGNPAAAPAVAGETAEEKQERIAAERFLQLLKRRPRLGTALDKVYGYHVGRGSLDDVVQ